MPLSESNLIYTFRGSLLPSLDFKPSVEWHRLAKCHLREIIPIKESLVWWQCLNSDNNLDFAEGNSHPLGKWGHREEHMWHTDKHRAVGCRQAFLCCQGPKPTPTRGSSWSPSAPRSPQNTQSERTLSTFVHAFFFSLHSYLIRVSIIHKKFRILYIRPESPPCYWHLDHKPVWFQYKI